jgi:hypothetical protein
MKTTAAALALLLSVSAGAQHYLKDIVGTRETSDLMKRYVQNKVTKVAVHTFDEKGSRISDLAIEQVFDGNSMKTVTRSGMNQVSILTSFVDQQARVIQTIDSNRMVYTKTSYTYNQSGQLERVSSTSTDSARSSTQIVEHLWQYRNNNPVRLIRIRNQKDTTVVDLKTDEKGNVIEEVETRRGIRSEPVYYYYNDNNQLTDVVQYNKKAKRLLPSSMMEYGPSGQVIQHITVPSGSDNYLIWRYQYNQQGLKVKEAIYNKQKELTGKIEYVYSFGT